MFIMTRPAPFARASRTYPITTLSRILAIGQTLAISGMYLSTFALAALEKWNSGVPGWFIVQFQSTWLARLPGGLTAVFYGLATLESLAGLAFALSLVSGEFRHARRPILWLSLLGSCALFIILAYGSRLTGHVETAGWNFVYLIGTLAALALDRRRDDGIGA